MSTAHALRPTPGTAWGTLLRWLRACAILLTLCGAGAPEAMAQSSIPKEYQVKAAFLYNIAKFVEWPSQSFANANAPIVIGILGENPFGDELDAIVKDRRINGRAIVIVQLDSVDSARNANLVYVSAAAFHRFAAAWKTLQQSPVLTVGETNDFENAGGMIHFVPIGDKLRFEINISAAENAGLKLSAQLQKLATHVRRSP